MRVLRAADYRRMPWKNGGGETIEMLVSPAGASFDDFDWRISMAHVAAPGPFSTFPGVDRTLSVIAGVGLSLMFDDGAVALDRTSEPFRFAGDISVDGALIDGPIDDLNLMTRRGRCDHRVTRHALVEATPLRRAGNVCVLFAIGGGIDVRVGAERVVLAPQDALVLDADDEADFTASPQGEADLFVLDVFDV